MCLAGDGNFLQMSRANRSASAPRLTGICTSLSLEVGNWKRADGVAELHDFVQVGRRSLNTRDPFISACG